MRKVKTIKLILNLLITFSCLFSFGQNSSISPKVILKGHQHKVSYLRYSRDGKYLVSGSWDNSVCVWDTYSYRLLHKFTGHSDWIRQVDISPDNKIVASCSQDGQIGVWDLDSGKLVKLFPISTEKIIKEGIIPELNRETVNSVASIAFSEDGKFFATGSIDNLIRIWESETLKLVYTLEGHTNSVFHLLFDHDIMISGAIYSELILWDTKTFSLINKINEKQGFNGSFHLLQNGKYLANTGKCMINIWEVSTNKLVRSIPVQCMLQSLEFTPDEKYMITCAEDHTVKIWDFNTEKEIWCYENPKPEIADCKLSPDGKYLAIATPENDILIWCLDDVIRTE